MISKYLFRNSSNATSNQTSSNIQNYNSGNGRVQRESRALTTKHLQQQNQLHSNTQHQSQQQQSTGATSTGTGQMTTLVKERLRGSSVSSNESVEVSTTTTTRRSVRQSTASPLATPAGNTRGASRSMEDINRRKTRSGAAGE